jgi:hypothetical protein
MDIASAYRMVPVHPDDRPLLAMQWADQIYFDTRLPFSLRSAPKIFTAVADALQWVFQKQGVSWVAHYLDDYITMGPPEADTCAKNLDTMLATCTRLGVPTAPGKCEGPDMALVFLGFELDTQAMEVRLPQQKLQRTLHLVQDWLQRRACRKHDLECLLGHLQHAAMVVRPGRTFVQRLTELLSAFRSREHWIRLGCTVLSDLQWWSCFMEGWNGVTLIPSTRPQQTPLVSDASGSWGCGAFWGPHWFQWRTPHTGQLWQGRPQSREHAPPGPHAAGC